MRSRPSYADWLQMALLVMTLSVDGIGCSSSSSCGPDSPGLTVRIIDRTETSDQCIANSTVTITEDTYSESYSSACTYSGARNRPGTYAVQASAPGYKSTGITGVVVQKDCGSWPTPVEIDMEKNP